MEEWESCFDLPASFIVDDVRGLHELKLSSRLYKTSEEVNRHCVDESLDGLARAELLLRDGFLPQQKYVVVALPRLLAENSVNAASTLLETLLCTIDTSNASEELIIACGKSFAESLPSFLFDDVLMDRIYTLSSRFAKGNSLAISQIWSEVYLWLIMNKLAVRKISETIVPEALKMGEYTQPSLSRIWSCRVLSACSSRLPADEAQKRLLPRLLGLCQDTDQDVRICMCNQIVHLSKVLGPVYCKTYIVAELLQLLDDEEPQVQIAALKTVANVARIVDIECKRNSLIPGLILLCKETNALTLQTLAYEIGPILWELRDALSSSDIDLFRLFYNSLCVSPISTVRCAVLHNLPAALQMNLISTDVQSLGTLVMNFSSDTCEDVRQKLAMVFPVLIPLLNTDTLKVLSIVFLRLLDDTILVARSFISHFDSIFAQFVTHTTFAPGQERADLLFHIIRKYGQFVGRKTWRDQLLMLKQCSRFCDFFDMTMLYDNWIPILLKCISEGSVQLVTNAAIWLLCLYVRKLIHVERPRNLCHTLVQDFAKAPLYRHRMAYLSICRQMLQCSSARFFQDCFLDPFLAMAKDHVIDVRMTVALLLRDIVQNQKIQGQVILKQLVQCLDQLQASTMNIEGRRALAECTQLLKDNTPLDPQVLALDKEREQQEYGHISDISLSLTTVTLNASNSGSNENKTESSTKKVSDRDRRKNIVNNVTKAKLRDKHQTPSYAPATGSPLTTRKSSISNGLLMSKSGKAVSADPPQRRPRLNSANAAVGKVAGRGSQELATIDSRFASLSSSTSSTLPSVSLPAMPPQQTHLPDHTNRENNRTQTSMYTTQPPSTSVRPHARTTGSNPSLQLNSPRDVGRRNSLVSNLVQKLGQSPSSLSPASSIEPSKRGNGAPFIEHSKQTVKLPAVIQPKTSH